MRFKNREISIFSLSTLDVIFGALGAFMIMMLAAMSGYNPDAADAGSIQQQLDEARDELAALEEQLAEELLAQRMFFAVAAWSVDVDVDLWLEANGEMFGPRDKNEPFGELPETQQIGGDETDAGWESVAIENATGTYRVFVRLHDLKNHRGPVVVRGAFVANSNQGQFGTRPLFGARIEADELGQMIEVARFELDEIGLIVESEMAYLDERFAS